MGKKSLKLSKPGSLAPLALSKEDDPLADLWPEFMMNPWITRPGSIHIKYLGGWKWSFEIPGPPTRMNKFSHSEVRAALRSWLSKLLTRMGRSLSYETGKPPSSSPPDFLSENPKEG
jgi:hypothetical protein